MEIKYSFTDYNDVLQTHLRLLRHAMKFEALEKLGGQSFCFSCFLLWLWVVCLDLGQS